MTNSELKAHCFSGHPQQANRTAELVKASANKKNTSTTSHCCNWTQKTRALAPAPVLPRFSLPLPLCQVAGNHDHPQPRQNRIDGIRELVKARASNNHGSNALNLEILRLTFVLL